MNEHDKEELIEQFRAYLEAEDTPEEPAEMIDQMALFNELAGLKNEVRIESRQLKGALDDFRAAFSSLDHAQQDADTMLQHIQQQERESARTAFKPVIFGLIDLYDRIAAGLDSKPPEISWPLRLLPTGQQEQKWVQGHLQGQKMLLGRVLDLLGQCGVSEVKCRGEAFDPNCMKAVGFTSDLQQENGTVLFENLIGFRQEGRMLRPAEVIVNKREE
jgi:molecular chaperone GrpE